MQSTDGVSYPTEKISNKLATIIHVVMWEHIKYPSEYYRTFIKGEGSKIVKRNTLYKTGVIFQGPLVGKSEK